MGRLGCGKLRLTEGKGLGRLSSTGTSFSYTFNNAFFKKLRDRWSGKKSDKGKGSGGKGGSDESGGSDSGSSGGAPDDGGSSSTPGGADADGYLHWDCKVFCHHGICIRVILVVS